MKIDTNTTQSSLYTGLTGASRDQTGLGPVVQVLSDGTEGDPGAGDRRYRNDLGVYTGSASYAFIIDDFANNPNGDRSTMDGVGIETVPEPSSSAILLGLGGLALLLHRRK